ncbi:hypothetical protein [Lactococcus cremoris]|uniref:hypothetical protein n=1 Tax=Lactococcus lactis subsp. cremoris TaxID=1359 RepID=UPI0007AEDBFC|nr:hypothetical protein [Lactococcus cremoris]KZK39963.1 hypothetical protein N41_0862 [Lactococcus cremoris]MCT0506810.1 hypothetical protein [Lactococcus cremoris]
MEMSNLDKWVEEVNNRKVDMTEIRKLIMPQNTGWLKTQESVDVFTSIMITDYPQAEKNRLWEVELEKHGIQKTPLQQLDIVEDRLYD